jgi:adenylate kinase family enzyme
MIDIKRTSIEIPTDTLIKIKEMAVRKGTTQNKIINELIHKGMEKTAQKGKIKAKLINNDLPKLEGQAENIEDLAGFVDLEYETNAVNLKDSIHTDKTRL